MAYVSDFSLILGCPSHWSCFYRMLFSSLEWYVLLLFYVSPFLHWQDWNFRQPFPSTILMKRFVQQCWSSLGPSGSNINSYYSSQATTSLASCTSMTRGTRCTMPTCWFERTVTVNLVVAEKLGRFLSPPVRWGLLDFMLVSSFLLLLLPSSFVALLVFFNREPHVSSVPCRTSTSRANARKNAGRYVRKTVRMKIRRYVRKNARKNFSKYVRMNVTRGKIPENKYGGFHCFEMPWWGLSL